MWAFLSQQGDQFQCEIMFEKGLVQFAELWYTIKNEFNHRRAL